MPALEGLTDKLTAALPGFTEDQIADAADAASAIIRGYCRRDFTAATSVAVVTTAGWFATLPAMDITDVSKVEVKQIGLDGSVSWVETTKYDWAPNGVLYATTTLAPWPADELPGGLRVTYSHGAGVPEDVLSVANRLAQRIARNPDVSVGYRIGEKDEKFYGASGKGQGDLTAYDRYVLDQYSIPVIR